MIVLRELPGRGVNVVASRVPFRRVKRPREVAIDLHRVSRIPERAAVNRGAVEDKTDLAECRITGILERALQVLDPYLPDCRGEWRGEDQAGVEKIGRVPVALEGDAHVEGQERRREVLFGRDAHVRVHGEREVGVGDGIARVGDGCALELREGSIVHRLEARPQSTQRIGVGATSVHSRVARRDVGDREDPVLDVLVAAGVVPGQPALVHQHAEGMLAPGVQVGVAVPVARPHVLLRCGLVADQRAVVQRRVVRHERVSRPGREVIRVRRLPDERQLLAVLVAAARVLEERRRGIAVPSDGRGRVDDARHLCPRTEDVLVGRPLGPVATTYSGRAVGIDAHVSDGVEPAVPAVGVHPAQEAGKQAHGPPPDTRLGAGASGGRRHDQSERDERRAPQSVLEPSVRHCPSPPHKGSHGV